MILKNFYEWPQWESISHSILLLLTVYILYKSYNKGMNVTDMLLLAIVIGIDTLIHQNINKRNSVKPTYLL